MGDREALDALCHEIGGAGICRIEEGPILPRASAGGGEAVDVR